MHDVGVSLQLVTNALTHSDIHMIHPPPPPPPPTHTYKENLMLSATKRMHERGNLKKFSSRLEQERKSQVEIFELPAIELWNYERD